MYVSTLKRITKVAVAAAKLANTAIDGVHLEPHPNGVRIAATDGEMLIEEIWEDPEINIREITLTAAAVRLLGKWLKLLPKHVDKVQWQNTDNTALVTWNDQSVALDHTTGTYPRYQQPLEHARTASSVSSVYKQGLNPAFFARLHTAWGCPVRFHNGDRGMYLTPLVLPPAAINMQALIMHISIPQ